MPNINIIAVPFHDWKKSQTEGFRTRDVHLLQEFIRHPSVDRILIVDRPISLIEMLLLRRRWHITGGECVYQHKYNRLTKINDKTFVLDMYSAQLASPLIKRRRWIPAVYGDPATSQGVTEAIHYLNLDQYVLFLSSPLPIPLYRQLRRPTLIVDAVDNMLKIPQFSKLQSEIASYYDEIRENADVVFSNSIATVEFLKKGNRPTIYIPNGVDYRHFRVIENQIPSDLQGFSQPIIGYAGKMQEIFDVDMLRHAAMALPDVIFICIGQLLNPKWMRPLWQLPNVKYLGDKHYDLLPSYLANFDICIIPYNLERQHFNDPIKFYEYLAMNKPVVTTRIGGVSAFEHCQQVKIVNNAAEFINALHYFLNLIRDGSKIPPVELPVDVLWSTKANKMIDVITQIMVDDDKT